MSSGVKSSALINSENYYLLMVTLPCIFMGIVYFTPVINVLLLSVTEPQPGLQNYKLLADSSALHRIFGNTLRIGLATTAITLVLGYLFALGLMAMKPRERSIAFFIVLASFWISALIRAYAWVAILQPNGVLNQLLMSIGLIDRPLALVRNEVGVIIGMVHYMLPYAILPIYTNMTGIDTRLMNAARALGASRWRSFWWVYFPLSLPGLAGGGLLVFIFSLGFYITPAVLGGGRVVMIAEYISIQISETLRWGLATMLATVLVLIVVSLTVWMSRFMQVGGTIAKKGGKS
ncbi:ABC transporter permease [Falsochrobactrum sp. TDYN1]|uniref:ABC transporter permease n=1 Tax=Falsochrobactrum tianjinense TaxID=2706015 RepID=A0A949PNG3_9HYPH|nr:ABC transporter permease [Falsochrobactrum sp. TDYN1]MBV2143560.1 ABC transporter permease [Falsochrobactrum sp. TDYN1]